MKILYYDSGSKLSFQERALACNFLYDALGQYSDPKPDIARAIDYAMDSPENSGLIALASLGSSIVGAAVINKTGMRGYIPENILVYIAIDANHRGKGLGQKLMKAIISRVEGDVCLHVEPDNPALRLYQKLGFVNKYLEMRLVRKEEQWPTSH